jgi:hypothetical protein
VGLIPTFVVLLGCEQVRLSLPIALASAALFRTERVEVIRTPIRAPRANAFAERWVRTVRTECLDWILVRGRRHLERALRAYARTTTVGDPIGACGSRRPSGRIPLPAYRPRPSGCSAAISSAASFTSTNAQHENLSSGTLQEEEAGSILVLHVYQPSPELILAHQLGLHRWSEGCDGGTICEGALGSFLRRASRTILGDPATSGQVRLLPTGRPR